MKRVLFLGLVVFFCGITAVAAIADEGCPTTNAHPTKSIEVTAPEYSEVTRAVAKYAVDISSDGVVSRAMIELSSGDRQIDLLHLIALRRTAFVPELRDCVRIGTHEIFNINLSNVPTKMQQTAMPRQEFPNCDTAVYSTGVYPLPPSDLRRGSAVGRAIAAIVVTKTGGPLDVAIALSSGDAKLDAETMRIALASKYTVLTSPRCPIGLRTAFVDLWFVRPTTLP